MARPRGPAAARTCCLCHWPAAPRALALPASAPLLPRKPGEEMMLPALSASLQLYYFFFFGGWEGEGISSRCPIPARKVPSRAGPGPSRPGS